MIWRASRLLILVLMVLAGAGVWPASRDASQADGPVNLAPNPSFEAATSPKGATPSLTGWHFVPDAAGTTSGLWDDQNPHSGARSIRLTGDYLLPLFPGSTACIAFPGAWETTERIPLESLASVDLGLYYRTQAGQLVTLTPIVQVILLDSTGNEVGSILFQAPFAPAAARWGQFQDMRLVQNLTPGAVATSARLRISFFASAQPCGSSVTTWFDDIAVSVTSSQAAAPSGCLDPARGPTQSTWSWNASNGQSGVMSVKKFDVTANEDQIVVSGLLGTNFVGRVIGDGFGGGFITAYAGPTGSDPFLQAGAFSQVISGTVTGLPGWSLIFFTAQLVTCDPIAQPKGTTTLAESPAGAPPAPASTADMLSLHK